MAIASDRPHELEGLLARGGPIGRGQARHRPPSPQSLGGSMPAGPGSGLPRVTSAGRTVLVVEHGGRRGSLRIKAKDGDVGEVRFGDGTRALLPLADLRLVCSATED